MNELNKIKIIFITVFTVINGWLGALAMPFYILVGMNIVDYITGVYAAKCRGERVSSDVGFRGIAKKICMWLLVAVGAAVDYIIIAMTAALGVEVGFKCIIAFAVIFWLLANEIISLLENISDIGAPLPPFLLKLAQIIKEKSEETVDITNSKNKEE